MNGYLVNENNIEESSRILYHLLDNPAELMTLSLEAKSTIQEHFLLATMVENYLKLYSKLLA